MCDIRDELTIDVGEDGLLVLAAGNQQVCKRVADGVGDVFEREVRIDGSAGDRDIRDGDAFVVGEDFTPVKPAVGEGEAIRDDLFECEVFVEVKRAVHCERVEFFVV